MAHDDFFHDAHFQSLEFPRWNRRFFSKQEFTKLVDDPSIPGSLSVILRWGSGDPGDPAQQEFMGQNSWGTTDFSLVLVLPSGKLT